MEQSGGYDVLRAESTVRAVDEQASSSLDGEEVILHTDSGVYYGLNAVGRYIWNRVQDPVTIERLVEQVATEFDTTIEECEPDVVDFLEDMYENDLIEVL